MSVDTTTADTQRYWTPETARDLANVEAVAEHYWNSAAEPQRTWAVAALQSLEPVTSVLDLGCQCGPNLRALHEWFPTMRLVGLDCNPHALAYGRTHLPSASFVEGSIPGALETWPDGAFDVVLSTYCLAYQSPDTICEALAHCLRIARVGLVLIEPMPNPDPEKLSVGGSGYVEWRHPYGLLLGSLIGTTQTARTLRWEPMPRYDTLTGALIVMPVRRLPDAV